MIAKTRSSCIHWHGCTCIKACHFQLTSSKRDMRRVAVPIRPASMVSTSGPRLSPPRRGRQARANTLEGGGRIFRFRSGQGIACHGNTVLKLWRIMESEKPQIAVYDTKPYDREYLSKAAGAEDLDLRFHDFRLEAATAFAADGREGGLRVCERSGPPAHSPKSGRARRRHGGSAMRWL